MPHRSGKSSAYTTKDIQAEAKRASRKRRAKKAKKPKKK